MLTATDNHFNRSMAQCIEMHISGIDLHIDRLLALPEVFTIEESSHAQVCINHELRFLDGIPVVWALFSDGHSVIHASVGVFTARLSDRFAGDELVQQGIEERAGDVLPRLGALEGFADLGVILARADTFEDAVPATLLGDLLFDVALYWLCGHGLAICGAILCNATVGLLSTNCDRLFGLCAAALALYFLS